MQVLNDRHHGTQISIKLVPVTANVKDNTFYRTL